MPVWMTVALSDTFAAPLARYMSFGGGSLGPPS